MRRFASVSATPAIVIGLIVVVGLMLFGHNANAANTAGEESRAIACFNEYDMTDQRNVDACKELLGRLEASESLCGKLQEFTNGSQEVKINVAAHTAVIGDAAYTFTQKCVTARTTLADCRTHVIGDSALVNVGPHGCCMFVTKKETIPVSGEQHQCVSEIERCTGVKDPYYYSCCVCDRPNQSGTTQIFMAESGLNHDSCTELCKKSFSDDKGSVNLQIGAGTLPSQKAQGGESLEERQQRLQYCFPQALCLSSDYAGPGNAESFRPGFGCPNGEGRCIAPEPEIKLSNPIGKVTTVKGFRGFISTIFSYLIGIVATVAAVMFVYAGFRYIFGSALEDMKRAKEIMVDASIGLLLVLGVIAILRTVNPMTLNLNKLEVFMINRSMILNERWCKNISSSKGAGLLFADAGVRPAFKQITEVNAGDYSVTRDNTECNKDYFAQDFGDFRCAGRRCSEPGTVCLSCGSGAGVVCPRGADSQSYACVAMAFGGNIDYLEERYPTSVKLIALCQDLLSADHRKTWDDIDNSSIEMSTAEPGNGGLGAQGSKDSGVATYRFKLTEADIGGVEAKCKDHGGVLGVFLGLQYHDEVSRIASAVKAGISAQGAVNTIGAVAFNLIRGSNDDAAIVGKSNCDKEDVFSGYHSGTTVGKTYIDMKRAMQCAITDKDVALHAPDQFYSLINAGTASAQGVWSTESAIKANIWSWDEVKASIGSNASPISCSFRLSSKNAIIDPSTDAKPPLCTALPD